MTMPITVFQGESPHASTEFAALSGPHSRGILAFNETAAGAFGWANTARSAVIADAPDMDNVVQCYGWPLEYAAPAHAGDLLITADASRAFVDWLAVNLSEQPESPGTSAPAQFAETVNLRALSVPRDARVRPGVSDFLAAHYIAGVASLRTLNECKAAIDEARRELDELEESAKESDLPPPSPEAKKSAWIILMQLVRVVPRDYAVAPWSDGAVIVYSSGGIGRRVSILCDSRGEASYYVIRPNGQNDKGDRRPVGKIPLDFICDALRELNSPLPE